MTDTDYAAHLAFVEHYFQTLSPKTLAGLGDIYNENAWLKNPFHAVRGLQPISDVYRRMFDKVSAPHFVIISSVLQDADAFLTWNFQYRPRRRPKRIQTIHGASHLRFDVDGRIHYHRDYWDAAEELYEKLPALGSLMRFLKAVARR